MKEPINQRSPERIESANRTVVLLSAALGLYCLVRAGLDLNQVITLGGSIPVAILIFLGALLFVAAGYAILRRGFRPNEWKIYTYASYAILVGVLAWYWNTPRESGAPSYLLSYAFNLICAAVAAGILLRFRLVGPRKQ